MFFNLGIKKWNLALKNLINDLEKDLQYAKRQAKIVSKSKKGN